MARPLATDWYSAPGEVLVPTINSTVRTAALPFVPPADSTVFVVLRSNAARTWTLSGAGGMGGTWTQLARQNTASYREYVVFMGKGVSGTSDTISISASGSTAQAARLWTFWMRHVGGLVADTTDPYRQTNASSSQGGTATTNSSYALGPLVAQERRMSLMVYGNTLTTGISPVPSLVSTTPPEQESWYLQTALAPEAFYPSFVLGMYVPRKTVPDVGPRITTTAPASSGNVYSMTTSTFTGTLVAEPIGDWEFRGSTSSMGLELEPPPGYSETLPFETAADIRINFGQTESLSFDGGSDMAVDLSSFLRVYPSEFDCHADVSMTLTRDRRPNNPYEHQSIFNPPPPLEATRD